MLESRQQGDVFGICRLHDGAVRVRGIHTRQLRLNPQHDAENDDNARHQNGTDEPEFVAVHS